MRLGRASRAAPAWSSLPAGVSSHPTEKQGGSDGIPLKGSSVAVGCRGLRTRAGRQK